MNYPAAEQRGITMELIVTRRKRRGTNPKRLENRKNLKFLSNEH